VYYDLMKGMDKLREKLPDYRGKRIYRFIVIGFIVFFCSLILQLLLDSLPRLFLHLTFLQILSPLTPIIGSLLLVIFGFLIISNFWRIRDKQLIKFGERAYQKSFRYVVFGIPMLFSVIVHSYFPSDFLVSYNTTRSLSWYLGNPISDFFDNITVCFFYLRLSLFLIFFIMGLIVIRKSLKIFGIDYMALVYVYYPEESALQNHDIYAILRHPTYHGLALLFIGSIFLRFSIYSIIYFIVYLIGINIHLKFVEEKELIERFGEIYRIYKKNVPALFVKLRDLKKYFHFIIK